MGRGVVMELNDATAVVMTDGVAFVEVPVEPGMVVGAIVELPVGTLSATLPADGPLALIERPENGAGGWRRTVFRLSGIDRRRRAWIGAAAACLAAVGILTAVQAREVWAMPYAYVSVDVNPSVEFTVNRAARVLAATPLDQDGNRLLRSLSLDGLPLREAVADYLRASDRAGFVGQKASVVVTTAAAGVDQTGDMTRLGENLAAQIQTMLTVSHVTVAALVVRPAILRAALAYHVSPGRLAVYVAARTAGLKVNWTDMVYGRMAQSVGGPNALATVVGHLQKNPAVLRDLNAIVPTRSTAGQPVGQLLKEVSETAGRLQNDAHAQSGTNGEGAPGSHADAAHAGGAGKVRTHAGKTREGTREHSGEAGGVAPAMAESPAQLVTAPPPVPGPSPAAHGGDRPPKSGEPQDAKESHSTGQTHSQKESHGHGGDKSEIGGPGRNDAHSGRQNTTGADGSEHGKAFGNPLPGGLLSGNPPPAVLSPGASSSVIPSGERGHGGYIGHERHQGGKERKGRHLENKGSRAGDGAGALSSSSGTSPGESAPSGSSSGGHSKHGQRGHSKHGQRGHSKHGQRGHSKHGQREHSKHGQRGHSGHDHPGYPGGDRGGQSQSESKKVRGGETGSGRGAGSGSADANQTGSTHHFGTPGSAGHGQDGGGQRKGDGRSSGKGGDGGDQGKGSGNGHSHPSH